MLALAVAGMGTPLAAQGRGPTVYISADMEGVAGLASMDDPQGRALMTAEVNAAIAGAFAGGATRVVVNDAHGSHENLLPDQLDPRVTLLRGHLKPYGMMEGLDSSFTAAVFVGYHAKASTVGSYAAHTGSGATRDLRVNGRSVGEAGINTLYAAWYGVPVVFVSGDSVATVEVRELVPGVITAAVKSGIWNRAVRTMTPDTARAHISAGVQRAVRGRRVRPPALRPPFTVEFEYQQAVSADVAEGLLGVRRAGPTTVAFATDRYPEAYRMIRILYKHLRP